MSTKYTIDTIDVTVQLIAVAAGNIDKPDSISIALFLQRWYETMKLVNDHALSGKVTTEAETQVITLLNEKMALSMALMLAKCGNREKIETSKLN